MSATDELRRLYPGHHVPERMVFIRDPSTAAVVNINGLNSASNASKNDDFGIEDKSIPPGTIQLIRFRAREPKKAPSPSTRNAEFNALTSLFDKLHFPLNSVLFARQNPRIEFSRLLGYPGDSDERPIFHVTGSRVCLIWTFDMKTRNTVAVLVNFIAEEYAASYNFGMVLEQVLQPYAACFGHPMLLAAVLAYFIQADTMRGYPADSKTLRQIEHRITVKSANRIDTMQRLRDLGRMTIKDRFILSALTKVMEFCVQVEDYYSHQSTTDEARQLSKIFNYHVRQRINLLDLDTRFLESISESVTIQQASIASILNMQDGASMKTMATITMLFLPATFVASFFAMPMFEWNNKLGRIVSRQFWIYWAVTIPLTLTILLAWLGWWYWHNASMHYDNPHSTSLEDMRTWFQTTFGRGTTHENHRSREGSMNRLGPLQNDKYRTFEDRFYDFEYEDAKSDGKTFIDPFRQPAALSDQENV